jgi:hypothetical protein
MKNITVTVDEDTYRRARIKAAELDTSVSALVKEFLGQLSSQGNEFERLRDTEKSLRDRIKDFSATERLSRDEIHARDR